MDIGLEGGRSTLDRGGVGDSLEAVLTGPGDAEADSSCREPNGEDDVVGDLGGPPN